MKKGITSNTCRGVNTCPASGDGYSDLELIDGEGTSWGTVPPNPGLPCRGDGSDATVNAICDGFPMYMKIDYIRIYQDLLTESTMAIGCDPSTHPTKQFIEDHIDEHLQQRQSLFLRLLWRVGWPALHDAAGGGFEWQGLRAVRHRLGAVLGILRRRDRLAAYKIMGQRNKKVMVVGAGVTGPVILSKVEMDDVPRSNGGSEDKLRFLLEALYSHKRRLIPTPMTFDPRCVAFEGRLDADLRTAEYVGRASHAADAACFRSSCAAASGERSTGLRVFYFETQIVSTFRDPDSGPARINTANSSVAYRRHAAQDRDAAATTVRDWSRRAERHAMDLEDVVLPSVNGASTGEPVSFDFSLNSRTMQQMRSRLERRRLRRSSERKKFDHRIAIGFLLDEAEQNSVGGNIAKSFINSGRSSGIMEARMSRRAVKQLMQRVLPDMTATGESESSEEETAGNKSRDVAPAVLHRDLGTAVNSLAYVGKTGKVIAHGREFLQCERYAAGDVVGCGVLLDTNTFFFTLNGQLMGMLAARDVNKLDDFGEAEAFEAEASEEEDSDSEEEDERDGVEADSGVRVRLDVIEDVDMEDIDGRHEEEKVLYPSVSLHGAGECVQAVFDQDEFQFDLPAFEKQIQKERQSALLAEREKRSENGAGRDLEQADRKDEAAMNELVQDFFLHYGYESAYKAFESAVAASKQQRLSFDDTEMADGAATEASTVTLGVSSVEDMEEDGKSEEMSIGDALAPPKKQQMRESLSLRHEVREHIRCFRTAQALAVLEQHVPRLMKNGRGYRSRRFRRLLEYCRILCVVDILTHESATKAATGSLATNGSSTLDDVQCKGWNPESAIEFARQVFGSSGESMKGKRKRRGESSGAQGKPDDVALVMSLCLYDRRESIPGTSRARKFLTAEFRESVADQINSFLLMSEESGNAEPRVSALETFMDDLEKLQKECLRQGCRVYPDSIETTTKCKRRSSSRRRASVSSSSDDSSLSQSQSEPDDRLEDDQDE